MMTLYVQNLAPRTTSEDIRLIFHQFGRVTDVGHVERENGGIPGRTVWVKMSSPSEAEAALHALNGKDLHGLPMQVLTPV